MAGDRAVLGREFQREEGMTSGPRLSEVEKDLMCGPIVSAKRERGLRYRFGKRPGGLWAGSGARPKWSPVAFFYFLDFFSLFFFLIFGFLQNLYKFHSKQLK
jgi:hypothetical protein